MIALLRPPDAEVRNFEASISKLIGESSQNL
jgi:hypothetical protein